MIDHKRVIAVTVSVALAAGLSGAIAPPSSSAPGPVAPRAGAAADTQVIDAKKDPAAAAKALNDFCQQLANCKFVGTTPISTSYGEARILGDALYNCGQAYADDSVAVSDERSESTSLSESLSAKVSAGLIGLAKQSIEAEVDSKQLEATSTTTTQTSSVSVPPGWKGWTQTRISSAYVAGDALVTDGIHLIKVTGIDLSFPGYASTSAGNVGIKWVGYKTPMTAADQHERCASLPGQAGVTGALDAPAPESLPVELCTRKAAIPPPAFAGSVGRKPRLRTCVTRHAIGNIVLTPGAAKATLARGRRTYAEGTARRSGILLNAWRKVGSGTYTLTLARSHQITVAPITIR